MKKIYIILIPLTMIMIPILVHFLMTIGKAESNNDWIGFFGSYSGGIIGGLVAFGVAKIQVKNNKEDVNNQIEFEKEKNIKNKALEERVYLDYTLDFGSVILNEIKPENNYILLHHKIDRFIHHNPNEYLSEQMASLLKTRFYGSASCILDLSITIKLSTQIDEDSEVETNVETMSMSGLNSFETIFVPLHLLSEMTSLIYVEFEYTTLGNERIRYVSDLIEESEEYFKVLEDEKLLSLKKKEFKNESYIVPGNPFSKN